MGTHLTHSHGVVDMSTPTQRLSRVIVFEQASPMLRREFLCGSLAGFSMLSGCVGDEADDPPDIQTETVRLSTGTSIYDTGLIDDLNEAFTARFGVPVEAIGQGTGAALESGRRGDVDLVLVHARPLEDAFLRDGYGTNRRRLMFNDFVVVGPEADPAGISESEAVEKAFASIATEGAVFISRGDESGTHLREQTIWEAAGIDPEGSWYRQVGSGMGDTLTHASLEQGAYTLADRGTFLSMQAEVDLSILVDGPIEDGPELLANPYGILAVNPARHEHVNYDVAMAYIGFLTSVDGQAVIEAYTVEGEQIFYPRALSENPDFAQYVPSDWREE